MTELVHIPDECVSPLEQHVAAADELANQINDLLDGIKHDERQLATNYVKLGVLLLKVRSEKHWVTWGYKSYGSYLLAIGEWIAKGRTQLYQITGIAEKLLPEVSEQDLQDIGISKAIELKRVLMLKPGVKLSSAIIEKAKDHGVTVERLRGEIFQEHNVKPEHAGTYRDFGGAYMTAEEWAEVTRAFKTAMKIDPVISQSMPEWAQRKEIMQRLCREFLATYEAQVMRGEGG